MPQKQGKVYLVGAGPGDSAYLTVQAQYLLTQAEVVVYDALVDLRLLEFTPESCLRLDVGKRGGYPSPNQETIDHLLVEHCQNGKWVVRLKSGDPLIFGRSLSEIQALRVAGCEFEVVPGLSSALAAPLLAGIPLTDPALSQCFVVLSAHDPASLNWRTLAEIDTLVILMGGRHLAEIVAQLQRRGRSLQTPVAVIRWGGHPNQQVWRGTLQDITQQTADSVLSPAVIVVGEVVKLQLQPAVTEIDSLPKSLNSPNQSQFHQAMTLPSRQDSAEISRGATPRPLAGKIILVTQAAGANSFAQLQQVGARVIEMPALEIGPPSSWSALDRAIAQLKTFDWLILTSTNGVDYFFERLHHQSRDARSLAGIQIAVVGKKTALRLKQQGLKPDFVPPDFVADALASDFPAGSDLTGTRILFPRVETGGRDTLVSGLAAKRAEVVEVPAYESRCPAVVSPTALDALQGQSVDVITFASSKTVRNFCQLLDQAVSRLNAPIGSPSHQWRAWLEKVCVASIGPQTSQACKTLLGRVDLEATEYTLEGLAQAIIDYYYP